jgi:hypothetical protein
MKFANNKNEDFAKKIAEFLFKVHEERKNVVSEL